MWRVAECSAAAALVAAMVEAVTVVGVKGVAKVAATVVEMVVGKEKKMQTMVASYELNLKATPLAVLRQYRTPLAVLRQ